ncbi:hypothetical protein Cme02nite_10260 [Catellatospora methionotrophica]|uniref:Uncharacterized protein n=2 Tax=Catellatospora methionotrophica TaxID=121620 RepID=A0A8J3PDI1_9ACTN|nr:hypothetical protein Cme02nite_10260 [Catellatospora methionotrophica]
MAQDVYIGPMDSMVLVVAGVACLFLVVIVVVVVSVVASRGSSRRGPTGVTHRPGGYVGPVHTGSTSGDPVWTEEQTWMHNSGASSGGSDSGSGWSGGGSDSGGGWSGGGSDSGGGSSSGGGGSDSGSSSSSS